MTEEKWLACTHRDQLLEFLRGKASDRKFRLFAVACGRRIWHLFTDPRSRKAVEVAERYADGLIGHADLVAAYNSAYDAPNNDGIDIRNVAVLAASPGLDFTSEVLLAAGNAAEALAGNWDDPDEAATQASWVRDIFGNPFRPITLDQTWVTTTVLSLARGIYEERRFDDLPFLADALEEAGCTNEDILNHRRQPGEHVRGCWALDLILSKE